MEQGNMFEAEAAIRKRLDEGNVQHESGSILLNASLTFLEELNIFPIDQNYPGVRARLAGVYLIYYVGQASLYGNLVGPSEDQPIYVGKSKTDILDRLSDHRRKIARAKDLEVTDFVFRFMTVNPRSYAPAIKEMLIDHYDPLWNNSTVKFSFGNAKDKKNNWFKYHVAMVNYRREEMIERVRNFQHHQ